MTPRRVRIMNSVGVVLKRLLAAVLLAGVLSTGLLVPTAEARPCFHAECD